VRGRIRRMDQIESYGHTRIQSLIEQKDRIAKDEVVIVEYTRARGVAMSEIAHKDDVKK
jgi:hypothetical protein